MKYVKIKAAIPKEMSALAKFAKRYKTSSGFKNELPTWDSFSDLARFVRAGNLMRKERYSSSNKKIDIWRNGGKIRIGDWVALSEDTAKEYGSQNLFSKKVPAKDLVVTNRERGEMIYAPFDFTVEQFFELVNN